MSHLFVTAETGPPACIDSACLVPNRGLISGSGAGLGGMRMLGTVNGVRARGSRCLAG